MMSFVQFSMTDNASYSMFYDFDDVTNRIQEFDNVFCSMLEDSDDVIW